MKSWDSVLRPIKTALWVALVPLCVIAGLWITDQRLVFNSSHSLPGYVYLIQVGVMPTTGEFIAFNPPPNPHISRGFIKMVGGVGGDFVHAEGRDYYIDGQFMGHSKEETLKGHKLEPGPVGVICEGCFYVYTPHKDSYDSRYKDIGWIAPSNVIGRAVRIL